MTNKPAILSNTLRAISMVAQRFDGWTNQFTGIGIWGRDKSLGTRYSEDCILSNEEITALYVGDDMAALIVDIVPDEMFRKGFEVVPEQGGDRQALNKAVRDQNVAGLFREGKRWGRCYGGAVIVIGADDGGNVDEPLHEDRIRTMLPSRVVDRRWCWPQTYYTDPKSPKYGLPETYLITTWSGSWGVKSVQIHETRLIIFGGVPTPADRKLQNNSWDYGVLQRCYGPLRQFENNFKSMELLLTDASQAVFSIKNLWDIIAQGKEDMLLKRMQMVDMSRSTARAMVIDMDVETFERKTTSFAGIADSIDRTALRLAASARIPVTVLMGQSPAGMNATGNSDLEWFYNSIEGDQEEIKPALRRFVSLICLAKDGPTKGVLPESIEIEFRPLRQLTEEQKSKIYAANATADVAYITEGVLTKDEVALSRFSPQGYSQNITIVRGPREEMMKPNAIDEELNAEPPPPATPSTSAPKPGTQGNAPPKSGQSNK